MVFFFFRGAEGAKPVGKSVNLAKEKGYRYKQPKLDSLPGWLALIRSSAPNVITLQRQ